MACAMQALTCNHSLINHTGHGSFAVMHTDKLNTAESAQLCKFIYKFVISTHLLGVAYQLTQTFVVWCGSCKKNCAQHNGKNKKV